MDERTILLVEDEKKIADTLALGLTEAGYAVALAYDGKEGWALFQAAAYDLVILDINLPGLNGYELCRQIRRHSAQVPVIMLTALTTLNDKIEGYDAGADDYIIKPFAFRELLLKMRALLRRTAEPPGRSDRVLKADDLEMNLDSKEVRRGDQSINLTAKEFQLLEYLLRNKNRVISRNEIAVKVWEIDFDTNTNVIDVYINYVRNKIDKRFGRRLIVTHVGMGYMLKDNS